MLSIAVLFLVLVSLGFPVQSWGGFIVLTISAAALLAGQPAKTTKRWLLAFGIAAVAMVIRATVPVPEIHQGHNVFAGGQPNSLVAQGMPTSVYERLEDIWQVQMGSPAPYPHAQTLFAPEPERLWRSTYLSRAVSSIDFDHRDELLMGALNDAAYNTYNRQKPERENLPFFVRFDIPEPLGAASDLCWQGELFLPGAGGEWRHVVNATLACMPLSGIVSDGNTVTIWAIEADPALPLSIYMDVPFIADAKAFLLSTMGMMAALAVLGILFSEISIRRFTWVIGSISLSTITAIIYDERVFRGFLLMEGGNDGLIHIHYARYVFESAFAGDWRAVLMGGEPVFDLQPAYRYVHAFFFALFGNTIFGGLVLLGLVPVALFSLVQQIFDRRWAVGLMVIYFTLPIFEAFGFLHLYFAKEFVRGFAEPLAYLLFFTGMTLTITSFSDGSGASALPTTRTFAFAGLAFAGAVLLRSNLLPGAGIYLTAVGLVLLWHHRVGTAAALTAAFLPAGLVPLHNWFFGTPETFVLFTKSGSRYPFNLGARLTDYGAALRSAADGMWDSPAIDAVTTHILSEWKPSEPWYYLVLGMALAMIVRPATSTRVRVVGLTALALQTLSLFYHVGGRYSYVTWILTLLVALVWIREVGIAWLQHPKMIALKGVR